jgi:bifunctional oligoribonuclease and PAP phosphatase NrnA
LNDGMPRVLEAMRAASRAAIAIHENPDLDAVGAAAGMIDLLSQLGVPAALHVDDGVRLPEHDWFLPAAAVRTGPPAAGDTLFVVDSGSLPRTALTLGDWTGTIVNIDHHPDNTGFGEVNLVMSETSSTSEIVCAVAGELGLVPSVTAAAGLYTGIAFDTGQFRHASTGSGTFRAAAALVEAGADPAAIYEAVFEGRSLTDLRVWARAVLSAQAVADGRALIATLTLAEYDGEGDGAEGVAEALRSVRGVEAAALVREQREGSRVRVSMRSHELDVGALARRRGGGGHQRAAGFSSEDSPEEVTRWLSSAFDELLRTASS